MPENHSENRNRSMASTLRTIRIECPICRASHSYAARQPHDPPTALWASVCCPGCGPQGADATTYYDSAGQPIPRSAAAPPTAAVG